MLYYNLGVTLLQHGEVEKAQEAFEGGIKVYPLHPTSHLALHRIYLHQNQTAPAILAGCRFLVLEPDTERAAAVLRSVEDLWNAGVEETKDGETIYAITYDEEGKEMEIEYSTDATLLSKGPE